MSNLAVATEIKRQLFCLGKIKVWSWGANSWAGGDNFLIFKVQGRHFTGKVKITLNSMDLYDIEFIRGKKTVVVNGVYNVDMVDIIDRKVEYIDAYKEN